MARNLRFRIHDGWWTRTDRHSKTYYPQCLFLRGDTLKDAHGREVTSLRISVTQRCNLKCFYCHREGETSPSGEMTPEEIGRLVAIAESLGMRKLKITGGEPLLRDDIVEVVSACNPHMKEVSITTNGILLKEKATDLLEAGMDRVNVSLDTVDPDTYGKITGVDALPSVLAGIEEAVSVGLTPVKLNMVLMKGINEDQVEQMIQLAGEKDVILQIIELETSREKINSGFYSRHHCDMGEIEASLRSRAERVVSRKMHHRMKYFLPTEVEVVRPMHNAEFCQNCNRLRITSDGLLKPCLLSSDGTLDVLSPMRAGASDQEIAELFKRVIQKRVPYWA